MNKKIDISIVIPALREEKRIGKTLSELKQYLVKDALIKKLEVEVIIVAADGGDKTVKVAKSYKDKLPNFKILALGKPVGKGRDVREGMLRATGDKIIFMDADLATPLKYLPSIYKKIEKGADVAIGTRNLHKHHKSLIRRALSNTGNLAYRIFGGVWVEDSQCGFKMFTKEASELCFNRLTILKWGFDMEVLSIAKQNNLNIATLRINDWHHVEGGNFDGEVLKHAKETLVDLLIIFLNRITGRYKT